MMNCVYLFVCIFFKNFYIGREVYFFLNKMYLYNCEIENNILVILYFILLMDVYRMFKWFRGLEILKIIVLMCIRMDIN